MWNRHDETKHFIEYLATLLKQEWDTYIEKCIYRYYNRKGEQYIHDQKFLFQMHKRNGHLKLSAGHI